MNKPVKILVTFTIAVAINLALTLTVFAENEMSDLHIEVELQEDGSGIVTEHRQMNMNEGTELFINMANLDGSEVTDFSVDGFEEETNWNSDASQEEKAGKYGVLSTNERTELVWGIGEYGENTYTVTYTLSDLVRNVEDGQAMLWNFDTFSDIPAQQLTVEISGFQPFTQEMVDFWGFGFEGDMHLVDDRIIWESHGEVDGNVIVLTQFPPGVFQVQQTEDITLSEQREEAMDGSVYNASDESSSAFIIAGIIIGLFLLVAIAIIFMGIKTNQAKREAGAMKSLQKRIAENKNKTYEKVPYTGEDYAGLSVLLGDLQLGHFEDIVQAYLLKWSMNEQILMEAEEVSKFFGEKYRTTLSIHDVEKQRNKYPISFRGIVEQIEEGTYSETYETGLWTMFLDVADANGVITDDVIQKWGKKHADEVSTFADYLKDYSEAYLERQGLFSFEEIKPLGIKQAVIVPSDEGDRLANRLLQFGNYLRESDINQFTAVSEPLSLQDMMLWSVLFGKSDNMSKKLEGFVLEDMSQEDGMYRYYWMCTYLTRTGLSTGLAHGGFNANTSSVAASGGGGATGIGGGGGAGGGGGGGAR
ncbi:DUF2207 domain-containing protein [Gracilibacillus timonensis]|uniref:DUF2207 domain-containing protein n=1 Tax=Gracilibacillus timonensis TaxID=1816696 RepID=UPI0008269F52|nr:DUF2207 domain-containing protein [Gracilibacillus timonensis]